MKRNQLRLEEMQGLLYMIRRLGINYNRRFISSLSATDSKDLMTMLGL